MRSKKKAIALHNQELENKEAKRLFDTYRERLYVIQQPGLDFYKRRKLAEDLVEFINININPSYRELFFQDVDKIISVYRQQEVKEQQEIETKQVGEEDKKFFNCIHIKIAYEIWNSCYSRLHNPTIVGQKLKSHYYDHEREAGVTPENRGVVVEETERRENGVEREIVVQEENEGVGRVESEEGERRIAEYINGTTVLENGKNVEC